MVFENNVRAVVSVWTLTPSERHVVPLHIWQSIGALKLISQSSHFVDSTKTCDLPVYWWSVSYPIQCAAWSHLPHNVLHSSYPQSVFFQLEQFQGTHKTGSKTWRFRCLLEKFEGTHGDFTQRLAGYTDDPYAFCDEVERITSGVVQHERKESSPELFPSPKPTAQEKGSAPAKQSRKRKDPPFESEEPGPSKRTKEVADVEAELQAHYIGTISFSLFLSLCFLLILCSECL